MTTEENGSVRDEESELTLGYELVSNKEDWEWYKKRLDADGKYSHRHDGAPERFPCGVESRWGDDSNGPYFYEHTFVYQQVVACSACGHETTVWP